MAAYRAFGITTSEGTEITLSGDVNDVAFALLLDFVEQVLGQKPLFSGEHIVVPGSRLGWTKE